mmetsp:Transcript_26665/g.57168  ORF Transcript_26665/g.57168 Transcript_26665/m.57168 type:complete len:99 (-) Transcript_26665:122-418(-)|eukprot:CAMPEP_0201119952 /NCGR_PEP_ID=MMETSP0850-20130426/4046_1 /ASSEMBLY_ACC=CAM_ASM_000622 /TAXON_ID=183588 /ORGANISM="Pseudo-nitzschia fraudulenta, Strain WWA7" /LENGTH=98 /DNA_ID=CAMNT_0047385875 /DNA_START=134 /DNA_END=430 /DNA_ORIENTATION=-
MSLSASKIVVARAMTRRAPVRQQKRGIVDYLTNYPDKVNEVKKIQCKGGTQLGESNPTWLKQSSDKVVAGFVFAVAGMGMFRLGYGYYRLATGKGKLE